ncbi:MAG: OprO/OprP family phosphate-selective porin [Lentisphaeria bacterium]|nr:OprO/OprP family phosphate-selective porin [Candidatus Neomarinimicrobiota bacterium]MCF7842059.1 OprO/OprP family phosphate-selective porin [Lentisphaeria bacterium]
MNKLRTSVLALVGFMLIHAGATLPAQDLDKIFFRPQTTIGGYGELHYNSSKPENGRNSATLDFHRFVLFFSHAWSEEFAFKSELEIEHNLIAGGKSSGEVELEQAYVDYHPNSYWGIQAGVLLPSVGIINEFHEPPLFFGVERPDYHKVIIPTTWFGNGAAIYGNIVQLDYRVVVMEGLDGTGFSAKEGIRGGRLKGYKADATHPVINLSLSKRNWLGMNLGGSVTMTQASDTLNGTSAVNQTLVSEFHLQFTQSNFHATAEMGQIQYDRPDLVGGVSAARGIYVDLGYDLAPLLGLSGAVIPWVRYSDINTAAKTDGTIPNLDQQHRYALWRVGLQVKPLPDVVYKLDFGKKMPETGADVSQLNLGVGYMF